MEHTQQKRRILIVAALLIVAAGAAWWKWDGGPPVRRGPAAADVVPDTDTTVPDGLARPTYVAPAAPNSAIRYRSFELTVSRAGFSPHTIAVHDGDIVHLTITATDDDYDFTLVQYGLAVPLLKGQAKVVEFQATGAGEKQFFCHSCGGPTKGPSGYLEVKERKL